jgi:hypothetical protein
LLQLRTLLQGDAGAKDLPAAFTIAIDCFESQAMPGVAVRVRLDTPLERIASTLATKLGCAAASIEMCWADGTLVSLDTTVHALRRDNLLGRLRWRFSAVAPAGPIVVESAQALTTVLSCDEPLPEGSPCDSSFCHLVISNVTVAGRLRPCKVVLNVLQGRVQFAWEPADGYECPVCVQPFLKDPFRRAQDPRMNRGEILRHLQRYHTALSTETAVCPLCSAHRPSSPVALHAHLQVSACLLAKCCW